MMPRKGCGTAKGRYLSSGDVLGIRRGTGSFSLVSRCLFDGLEARLYLDSFFAVAFVERGARFGVGNDHLDVHDVAGHVDVGSQDVQAQLIRYMRHLVLDLS